MGVLVENFFSKFFGVIAASTLLLGMTPSVAQADERISIPHEQEVELRAFFDENGVSTENQELLLIKFDQGQPWDSFSGADPVRTDVSTLNGEVKTVEHFADGSLSITTVELPATAPQDPNTVAPMGISGCQLTSSSSYHASYRNCYGEVNKGIIGMGFHLDRDTYSGGLGRITNYYGANHWIVGGALGATGSNGSHSRRCGILLTSMLHGRDSLSAGLLGWK